MNAAGSRIIGTYKSLNAVLMNAAILGKDPHGQVNFAKESVSCNFLTVATSLLTLCIIVTPFS